MKSQATREDVSVRAGPSGLIGRGSSGGSIVSVPLFHPEITLVFPGFAGPEVEGREAMVAGFADFCQNATIHEYREANHQADVIGDTAVASFTYEMVYERSAKRSLRDGPRSVDSARRERVGRRLENNARTSPNNPTRKRISFGMPRMSCGLSPMQLRERCEKMAHC